MISNDNKDAIRRAASIKMIVLDVDGVMTDGRVHISAEKVESKSFDIRDGFGIHAARSMGLEFGIITGLMSPIVEYRAGQFNIAEVHQGFRDKAEVMEGILQRGSLRYHEVCYMGDDLFDLPVLRRVGLSTAPADAHPLVLAEVHWVSSCKGGRGAVRELIELVIKGRGLWERYWNEFAGE